MRKLGKGLDAILSEEKTVEESKEKPVEVEKQEEKKSYLEAIPEEALIKAFDEASKNPRVVIWSPRASFILRVLRKTTPEFSISEEAAKILEEGIKEKYPDLWKAIEKIEEATKVEEELKKRHPETWKLLEKIKEVKT
ncbi:MAG: hypothetical protein RMH75_07085 [Archaeoglobaceae archaeon]|nr:hypothetical protein [Archaeoglobaceae archaeon]MDW7990404.1 hypothetical protein [Archaeoglobaceae archaeon]